MDAENLSHELFRQRGILENLLYKFTTQRLLITNGESRWLGRCTAEIEVLSKQLATNMLTVDVLSLSLARTWGAPCEQAPTLRELVEAAPAEGPWKLALADHHRAISSLTEQIKSVSAENSQFVRAAQISLQDAGQSGSAVTYTATGTAAPTQSGSTLLDRVG